MNESCPATQEKTQAVTTSQKRNKFAITQIRDDSRTNPMGSQAPITLSAMCKARPDVFRISAPAPKPSFTLADWAARQ